MEWECNIAAFLGTRPRYRDQKDGVRRLTILVWGCAIEADDERIRGRFELSCKSTWSGSQGGSTQWQLCYP